MKKDSGTKGALNLIAYVALMVFALLEIISILGHFEILNISGGILLALLTTIKNLCVCIVIGVVAFAFTSGQKKWVKVLYWVALSIVVVCTVLTWL